MPRKKTVIPAVVVLISGGLGVALFTFVADKAWIAYSRRSLREPYVHTSLHFEEQSLMLFIRNDSDDPLDLVQVSLEINDSSIGATTTLGLYPERSHTYSVSVPKGTGKLATIGDNIAITLHLIQSINPRSIDHFGFTINGPLGPIDLSHARVRGWLKDINGHTYPLDYSK